MVFMGSLQQLGRAFMLPMIVLPGAAIFLSLSKLPWAYIGLPGMEGYLLAASDIIFTFLPYIFALGISLGLTGNALAAGMAALVGMIIYSGITGTAEVQIEPTVLIGTIIGIMAGVSHERFKSLRLPEYIQFFGGPRFVPLFVSFVSLLFSIGMIKIAPYLQQMLVELGEIVASGGGFGVFLYGFVHRILVVFG
ncbi:MAG TPA: PTS transporter subunit EIIC, partial [Candidatus Udaeobacter sp.]|nr:PTS transporter subunit EIIC [Candidatus Udaeobacter sp.]